MTIFFSLGNRRVALYKRKGEKRLLHQVFSCISKVECVWEWLLLYLHSYIFLYGIMVHVKICVKLFGVQKYTCLGRLVHYGKVTKLLPVSWYSLDVPYNFFAFPPFIEKKVHVMEKNLFIQFFCVCSIYFLFVISAR